ncbi:MAG: hypothetical protein ACI9SE_003374 [Neolewinella sp.]|jgi:hypothetical protein
METQDVKTIIRSKQARGAQIVRHWLLLAVIVIGAGAIGLIGSAWIW